MHIYIYISIHKQSFSRKVEAISSSPPNESTSINKNMSRPLGQLPLKPPWKIHWGSRQLFSSFQKLLGVIFQYVNIIIISRCFSLVKCTVIKIDHLYRISQNFGGIKTHLETPWKMNGWNLKITQLKRKIIWTKPPWLWVPCIIIW